ncbi:MAG TPA: hypothetical protein PKC43_04255 [Phycisphaerales bacterium]|nr:hypothetical protein [Phycisphaerales bacterium]HMP36640.1 hypothetical protein [Phycisphaerales bacterium]
MTAASGPSVIQIRAQSVLPEQIGPPVVSLIQEHGGILESGAILTVDEIAGRVRVLPIGRRGEAP